MRGLATELTAEKYRRGGRAFYAQVYGPRLPRIVERSLAAGVVGLVLVVLGLCLPGASGLVWLDERAAAFGNDRHP